MVKTIYVTFDKLILENGYKLSDFQIAYETHGVLNKKKDNAILIYHALSGGSHVFGDLERTSDDETLNPKEFLDKKGYFKEPKKGWWDIALGEGKAFDPSKYFIICANYIGGCYGSTGPSSINPKTAKRYSNRFPVITVKDIVKSQNMLLHHLGIDKLFCAAGGSFGGMCVLESSVSFPEMAHLYIPIATSAVRMNITISRNNNQKYAITRDPFYKNGNYYNCNWPNGWPVNGLKLARMIAHESYVDLDEKNISDEIIPNDKSIDTYEVKNPVESFMHNQGNRFIMRFDPNTYVKFLDAINLFDLLKNHDAKSLSGLFRNSNSEFLVIGISNDYCFYESQSRDLANALSLAGKNVSYRVIDSKKGHDAFLCEEEQMNDYIKPVLDRSYSRFIKNS
jgi:homoserine O-acetyltransferase/O-succinyltransferase